MKKKNLIILQLSYLAVLIVVATVFITLTTFGSPHRVALKSAACAVFVLGGALNLGLVLRNGQKNMTSILIFIALVLSFAGDIAICYKFILGLGLFLVGHIFYIAGFCFINRLGWSTILPASVAMAITLSIVLFVPSLNFGKYLSAVLVYAVIISCMFGRACGVAFDGKQNTYLRLCASFGATSFIISDALLAFVRFSNVGAIYSVACLVFYFIAQYLFSQCIYAASAKPRQRSRTNIDSCLLAIFIIPFFKSSEHMADTLQQDNIKEIVERQREFFKTGATLPPEFRIEALKRLKAAIISRENEIFTALKEDLGKSRFESYMCELGMTLAELTYMIKNTKRFARDKTVSTPLVHFPARSYVKKSPYGCVLIMSPWNYPFMLTMEPLVNAIAAGNTVVLKPSEYSPATSTIIVDIIKQVFSPEYVTVVTGGREENSTLLDMPFDKIFFTGSVAVGKEVMRRAAEQLIPVTLELGGKSPCIVDKSANIPLAAKRIVFGKFLNCGQTCVAPDHVVVHSSIKDKFLEELKKQIKEQYGEFPLENPDYGKIITRKHYDRICALIDENKLYFGGKKDDVLLRIEPTILTDVTRSDAVMAEEIFGPVLPILTFENIDDLIFEINSQPHPLALYVFSSDAKIIKNVTERCIFGGGCVNDTIIHLATSNMGFGGVGASGMGSYHGKDGFNCFSHKKSIVEKSTLIDLPMRYQPYSKSKEKIVRMFLK